MNTTKEPLKWFFLLMSLLTAGCAATLKNAVYLDPGFQSSAVQEITLLPIIDARIDTTFEVNMEKQIRKEVKDRLVSSGYRVNITSTKGTSEGLIEEKLKTADSQLIKQLGPPASRWVMIVFLNDVETKLTFGSTGNAEISGFLFDKETGTRIWQDKGVGQAGQGGLLGMMMKGASGDDAIERAVKDLVQSIPERPKDAK